MTILATHKATPGSYAVTWQVYGRKYHGQTHVITYGKSTTTLHCDLKAGREFGECVRHSAECAGIFDEENR